MRWRRWSLGGRRYGATASPRLRVAVGISALAVSFLLVLVASEAWGGARRLAVVVGAVAILFQLLAVVRWPATAAPGTLLLGLLGGIAVIPSANQGLAVEMAVLFLAVTELTAWATRLRSVVPETGTSIARQLAAVGAVVAGGGLVAAAILAAGRAPGVPTGRAALLVGLVAAVVPVALLGARWWRRAS